MISTVPIELLVGAVCSVAALLATTVLSDDSLTAGKATDETEKVVSISALLIGDVDVEIQL
ncbi:hypothetical protein [Limosilactobacillus reuteri]|uniref:hypothetical protein n=1 Tax=Limosilactobacillus reuteri TaxID=1598 RepID=UPI001157591C|nr:hypothetical protein [Limosilactobacillus reuteri]VTZ95409.1 hypothetical protein LREP572_02148 [Limosilactobacillus reuteri]